MTGRIHDTAKTEQQGAAPPEIARRFVSAILDHIDDILVLALSAPRIPWDS